MKKSHLLIGISLLLSFVAIKSTLATRGGPHDIPHDEEQKSSYIGETYDTSHIELSLQQQNRVPCKVQTSQQGQNEVKNLLKRRRPPVMEKVQHEPLPKRICTRHPNELSVIQKLSPLRDVIARTTALEMGLLDDALPYYLCGYPQQHQLNFFPPPPPPPPPPPSSSYAPLEQQQLNSFPPSFSYAPLEQQQLNSFPPPSSS